METKKAIEERRSIRGFKNEDISREVVEDILNCGRLAPSAKNRQPWYFVILRNDMKDKVADLMIEYTQKNDESEERKKLNAPGSVNPTADVIKQAPILVLIFRQEDDNWLVGDNLSIGACVENICLRATDLGLGSLWIRDIVYVSKQVAEMLGHGDLELNCAVLLGVPNQNPKQRPRKELKDIMEWY
jgi:nitroreductase